MDLVIYEEFAACRFLVIDADGTIQGRRTWWYTSSKVLHIGVDRIVLACRTMNAEYLRQRTKQFAIEILKKRNAAKKPRPGSNGYITKSAQAASGG